MELRIVKIKAADVPQGVAISQADALTNVDKEVLQYRYLIDSTTHLRTDYRGGVMSVEETHSEWMDVPTVEESPNVMIGIPRSVPQLKTEISKLEIELRDKEAKLNSMSLGMEKLRLKGLFARVWAAILNKPLVFGV